MTPLLEILPSADTSTSGVLLSIGVIASVGVNILTLARMSSGKAQERQIEPTALASLNSALSEQTELLQRINRESGETATRVDLIGKEIAQIRESQRHDVESLFQRVNGISRDLSHLQGQFQTHIQNHPKS